MRKPTLASTLSGVTRLRDQLSQQFANRPSLKRNGDRRGRLAIACVLVFLIAVGIRVLQWQDNRRESGLGSLTHSYLNQAEQLLDGEGMLFPRNYDDPTNAQLLVHPPGYSIFAAAVFKVFGNSRDGLTITQIIADGAATVMVVLIAAELFPFAAGLLAGLLAALSPHLAHYSMFLLPDVLSALPLLVAIYIVARTFRNPRPVPIIAAGFSIGVCCWLRSNALLLAPFIAAAVWLLLERRRRLRYSLAMIAAAIITISPITIRNWVVFDRFIPLSLGAGVTMIEGIADYDKEKRFGMPVSDSDTKHKDVEWHNRLDYGGGLWKPDGIERDRYRFRRGVEVIRANPLWFAGVMIRRAGFMLRYDSPESAGWPFDTARVPVTALEPGYGHQLTISATSQPVWTVSPQELKATGEKLAEQAELRVTPDGKVLEVTGDASGFGDQIASAPIPVEKNTDYLLTFPVRLVQGRAAAKVTSVDRRIGVASALLRQPTRRSKPETLVDGEDTDKPLTNDESERDEEPVVEMPFATGNRTEVRLVISNDDVSSFRPTVQIGEPKLYVAGPTPHLWTRLARPAIRAIQRNVYTTSRMLPLVLIGIVLVAGARRKDALLLVLVVPSYYLILQSAFHTEYRYILPIHYFLFIAAAVSLYCGWKLAARGANKAIGALRRKRIEQL